MTDVFSTAVIVNAESAKVWTVLTNPELMSKWMGEPEMEVEILTSWKVNTPIIICGFHNEKFENKGIVLQYESEQKLSYTHLSSVSKLPDRPESYSVFEFILLRIEKGTLLTLNITNFPTETIRKHLEFYWKATMVQIKTSLEEQAS